MSSVAKTVPSRCPNVKSRWNRNCNHRKRLWAYVYWTQTVRVVGTRQYSDRRRVCICEFLCSSTRITQQPINLATTLAQSHTSWDQKIKSQGQMVRQCQNELCPVNSVGVRLQLQLFYLPSLVKLKAVFRGSVLGVTGSHSVTFDDLEWPWKAGR